MYLSIVIPAYNEENRIGPTLSLMHDYFFSRDYDHEVILVDDGSTDGTVPEAERSRFVSESRLKIVQNGVNRGKGFSVRNGIMNSRGEYVLICDADMSTPIEEMDKLAGYFHEGYDIVIGSRSIKGSDVRVRQPWYRERMGKTFNFLVKLILMGGIKDTQCGFKVFKGDIAREIAYDLRIDGFCYDVEMLYLAEKKGYRIKEVGIVWDNSPQSKVKIMGSSLNMFFDLVKIKRLHG
ncbi:MAG: dolichyl-phosphate beta-glucosyltransferase [Candidatus Omnitrophota bacterium]|nr:dolichyl-phosphate beta-glucosyltransferase [Candidatus Omnitrophota bacterium]